MKQDNREWWQIDNVNPTLLIMKELGWQGGTIHQVCRELNCSIENILYDGRKKFIEMYKLAGDLKNQKRTLAA